MEKNVPEAGVDPAGPREPVNLLEGKHCLVGVVAVMAGDAAKHVVLIAQLLLEEAHARACRSETEPREEDRRLKDLAGGGVARRWDHLHAYLVVLRMLRLQTHANGSLAFDHAQLPPVAEDADADRSGYGGAELCQHGQPGVHDARPGERCLEDRSHPHREESRLRLTRDGLEDPGFRDQWPDAVAPGRSRSGGPDRLAIQSQYDCVAGPHRAQHALEE